MDITVKITKEKESRSYTFIGEKESILPDIKALIQKNKGEKIEVVSEENNPDLSFKELFEEEDKWWEKIPHGPSMGE